jgi:hypothetical protein
MNCQDLCRILDSRDVNALAAAERRACEAHAASCPHCGPEWVVYTHLAAIPAALMPQQLALRCAAVAETHLGRSLRRASSRTVLPATILVVAAAAAMLVAKLINAPPEAEALEGFIPAAKQVETALASSTPATASPPAGAAVPPITVQLVLDQMATDATGRDYGQRVYERARVELGALAGVVLVEGDTAATAPAFRITYTNFSKYPAGPEPNIAVEMLFKVEALRRSADGAGIYQNVFWSHPPPFRVADIPPSIMAEYLQPFDRKFVTLRASARRSFRPAAQPGVPAGCIERRDSRCPYTPADIAAFTILSWRLETTAPDPLLVARLHAMLRDPSTPPGLWLMSLDNLQKHGKLRLELHELLAAWERVGDDDAALGEELMRETLKVASRPELMRQVRELLLREPPNERRQTGGGFRTGLVLLLATELQNEPEARSMLESVAATDPVFEVRAAAKRALGVEPEPAPKPQSFMGPIEEP